jgi:predicted aspartyl protease
MTRLIARLVVWALTLHAATAVSAAPYQTIPMNQKQLATYYVDVSLAGSGELEFMVDTGAGYTTINEHTLEILLQGGNAVYVGQLTGVMADGSQHHLPLYRIKRLVLGRDCVLHDVEAAVFPQDTRMLLGLSALEKAAPFVFSTNPPRLSLSNCGTVSG